MGVLRGGGTGDVGTRGGGPRDVDTGRGSSKDCKYWEYAYWGGQGVLGGETTGGWGYWGCGYCAWGVPGTGCTGNVGTRGRDGTRGCQLRGDVGTRGLQKGGAPKYGHRVGKKMPEDGGTRGWGYRRVRTPGGGTRRLQIQGDEGARGCDFGGCGYQMDTGTGGDTVAKGMGAPEGCGYQRDAGTRGMQVPVECGTRVANSWGMWTPGDLGTGYHRGAGWGSVPPRIPRAGGDETGTSWRLFRGR